MITSEARREANRSNARKSTGPKTAEGKDASRRNALKHGLTARVVDVDTPEAREARLQAVCDATRPQTEWQQWVCGELAAATLRIDRVAVVEHAAREAAAHRAGLMWDDDRRAEAAQLGARLAADPARVVARLRITPHGCNWLIERWSLLLNAVVPGEGRPAASWTEDQRRLAFDLLGTPTGLRPEAFPIPEFEIARTALDELHDQRDLAAEVDAVERDRAEHDLIDAPNPELRRVRRYEAALHRRLGWCLDQMSRPAPAAGPARVEAPKPPIAPVEPTAPPQPIPAPPTPQPSATIPTPAQPAEPPHRSRRDERLRKAEARRAAKQRKRDRLLG